MVFQHFIPVTHFRPCIDLHQGKVKQIVGGSLRDEGEGPTENFVAENPPEWFAETFRADELSGGHVIKLGPGNDEAARAALSAWPGGLQIGGGINHDNASEWLDAGASHVIVTSALFDAESRFQQEVLDEFVSRIGKQRLVIDLSCRRHQKSSDWIVAMNRWQTFTDLKLNHETLDRLAPYCAEFLIHAADVEGLCGGIDEALVEMLGKWGKIPVTYAGGATNLDELEAIDRCSEGRVDVTVGSALDLFGGKTLAYKDLVKWNHRKD